jgi:hypothetical protein
LISFRKVAQREVARANAIKEEGNRYFRADDSVKAHQLYSAGLLVVPIDDTQGDEHIRGGIALARITLLANRAAACLSLGWTTAAVIDASLAMAVLHACWHILRWASSNEPRLI